MQQKSGIGYGYTVVAEEVGSYYRSNGWGSILTQSSLANDDWTLKPGDVGYNSGHTWIVIGQCSDRALLSFTPLLRQEARFPEQVLQAVIMTAKP